MKMLIVDDSLYNSIVIKRAAMKVFGGEIDVEMSPMKAINLCMQKKYDILIIDYYMKELNGLEFTNIVRNIDEYSQTPIITATSCDDLNIYNKIMRINNNDFIKKPINFELFRKKISYHLSTIPNNYAIQ